METHGQVLETVSQETLSWAKTVTRNRTVLRDPRTRVAFSKSASVCLFSVPELQIVLKGADDYATDMAPGFKGKTLNFR